MNLLRLSVLLLSAALGTAACHSNTADTAAAGGADTAAVTLLKAGPWRGELAAQGQTIPFLFEVKTEAGKPVVYLVNKGLDGEERLRCPEITQAGDSVTVRMHVFDAALVLRADGADKLKGTWVKYDAKTPYRVPLVAQPNTIGSTLFFSEHSQNKVLVPVLGTGDEMQSTYKVTFTDKDNKSYPAVGVFKYDKLGTINGTFLTSTGDYRYLAGDVVMRGKEPVLMLSTFDGNHGFLFTATPVKINSPRESIGELKGDFYSGKSGHETWTAVRDDKAKLPDANALTAMKPGQKRLDFKFPSVVAGGSVSPSDPKYKGKVVVVQILGSWCPNCMDETNFLAPWYEKNKQRGVEIIGLGYERSPDYAKASERLRKMRERFNIKYDLAVAGVSNKDSASKSLPQLAQVLAFPTTIFLDKKGEVRKIHTGFSGPGTGKYYQQETAEFEQTVDKLLKE